MSLFNQRSQKPELMDDLSCSGEVVNRTLRELEIINHWLGGNAVTLRGVRHLLVGTSPQTEIHVADLGCGGGDLLMRLADWGRKRNIPLRLTGIDANPNIISFAINHCKHYPEISFEILDVFSPEFGTRNFDVVLATLFMHHFSTDALTMLFQSLVKQTRSGIVINDLHRHWFAFQSIRLLTHFFSKSTMVKADAPLSVLRAFTRHELEGILANAGILTYALEWKWAFRWQIIIPGLLS